MILSDYTILMFISMKQGKILDYMALFLIYLHMITLLRVTLDFIGATLQKLGLIFLLLNILNKLREEVYGQVRQIFQNLLSLWVLIQKKFYKNGLMLVGMHHCPRIFHWAIIKADGHIAQLKIFQKLALDLILLSYHLMSYGLILM